MITRAEINLPSAACEDLLPRLQAALGSAIRGKSAVIRLATAALVAGGHLLIEDVPGVGKTTLARAMARALNCSFQRIQFTSDMLPSDVIGVSVFNARTQEFEFRRGPIFANIVLADEINRTTPKTQSALLEAMNEAQVTADHHTYALPQPFMVIATQNPGEHHGTFPLPESQLDRFLMKLEMGYPPAEAEREIVRQGGRTESLAEAEPVMTAGEALELQCVLGRIRVDEDLLSYALAIIEKTRRHERLALGVSPRGSMAFCRAAQAMALLDGRRYCIPDDFKEVALPVLAHRCIAKRHGSSAGLGGARDAVREILEHTSVPL